MFCSLQRWIDRFSVLFKNESAKPKAIPKGKVIAYVRKAEVVTQHAETPSSTLDPAIFNFGDSPIPENWKNRLAQKLAGQPQVFSLSEWDVGLARGVEHCIRLEDPFPRESQASGPSRNRRCTGATGAPCCRDYQRIPQPVRLSHSDS